METKNSNPYTCKICGYDKYKNANGLVRHIENKHADCISLEGYYQQHVDLGLFKTIVSAKFKTNDDSFMAWRLTSTCMTCKKPNSCEFQSFGKGFSAFCSLDFGTVAI